VCEGRDPGDLTTMEDPSALEQVSYSNQADAASPPMNLDFKKQFP
jgi:hypothetical protein